MDYGQRNYPQYFPAAEPTQSAPLFLYRYYPSTGIYLGVVVSANNQGYSPGGVDCPHSATPCTSAKILSRP
jgi:hypothetical protein